MGFHANCIACDSDNPHSLGLKFMPLRSGQVEAHFWASAMYQGYPDRLHGGITSTLLDAAMTHCLFHLGIEAVTAELNVRFQKPIHLNQQLRVMAEKVSSKRKLHQLKAWIYRDQELLAQATAKFIAEDFI